MLRGNLFQLYIFIKASRTTCFMHHLLVQFSTIRSGGHRGFSKVLWGLKSKREGEYPALTFTYHSFDGEQGTSL